MDKGEMDKGEIKKLLTYLQENIRTSKTSGLEFVDTNNFKSQLNSRQNYVVFGRRGAGKTSLLSSARGAKDHLNIYIDLEDHKDITFPNVVIKVLFEMFDGLDKQVRKSYPWFKF